MARGTGPQINIDTKRFTFYFQVLPTISYTHLDWKVPSRGAKSSRSKGNITIEAELGFLTFVSERGNFRVFLRSNTQDQSLIEPMFLDAYPEGTKVVGSTDLLSGFAFGYYLPEMKQSLTDWLL